MPKNDIDSDLRARVDAFVSDLSGLIRSAALDAVQRALGSSAAPAARRGRPAGKARKAPTARDPRANAAGRSANGRRRSSADLESLAGIVHAHVRENPGQRLEQIGADLGRPTAELKRPIQHLLQSGALRTEGQRRGTKYFAGGAGTRSTKGKRKTAKKAKRRGARRKTGGRRAKVLAAA